MKKKELSPKSIYFNFYKNKYLFLSRFRFRSNFCLYFAQWKTQFTKANFEIFMIEFTENIAKSFELYIYGKKFHQIGALLLDKVLK